MTLGNTRDPRWSVLLTLAICVAGAVTFAQVSTVPSAGSLTLEQAIARALDANPAVAAARLQRPVDAAAVAVAAERPNPEAVYEVSKETPHQSLAASVPIELGGKRQRRIDVANAAVAVGDADLVRVEMDIRNDVRRAYFQVVAARAQVLMADDLEALAIRASDGARARFSAGDAPQSDVTQSELALARAQSDAVGARADAAVAWMELQALMGNTNAPIAPLADTLMSGTLPPVEAALLLATESNADLHAIDTQIAQQKAQLALARALTVPDVAPGATVTYGAQPEFQFGWRMSVGVTVPVFTRHRAGIVVEQATLTRVQSERVAVEARISAGIRAAVARAAAAREQAQRYQSLIRPLAEEAERQAQAAYDGGQIGLPALIQALQIARDTRAVGLQAGLDYQVALADLERAIGAPVK